MVTLTKEPQVHEPQQSPFACENAEDYVDDWPITVDDLIDELICDVHHS